MVASIDLTVEIYRLHSRLEQRFISLLHTEFLNSVVVVQAFVIEKS
jgi:hypothetical protein